MLFVTQQGLPVILKALMSPGGFDRVSLRFLYDRSHKFVGPVELVQHHSTQLDGFLTLAQLPLNRPVGMSPIVLQGLNANDLEHNLRLKAIEMGLKTHNLALYTHASISI
ncbi:unnamed protein product [Schistosoma mattheei]|uniref:Uncharacterized protein n=1 Tax=Schistosoma mattheei TaxID=31246 RepID=A0A183P646_9TREM|nr:unnamed protein product [Schistosoma mattheei]